MTELNVYKTYPGVGTPTFATKQSACFDLAFSALGIRAITGQTKPLNGVLHQTVLFT